MYSPAFRFARSSHLQAARPLTDDELRKVAPSIFAAAAHTSRSTRYAYIPTIDVLNGLRGEGFEVFSARQALCRTEDRKDHTKHLLRLRHNSQIDKGASVSGSIPEILMLNSHDGTTSYQMMGGAFRVVCANGMVVPEGICQTVRTPHSGQVNDKVISGAFEVLDGLTRVVESQEQLRAVTLNDGEAAAFARAALALRFEPKSGSDGQAQVAPPVTEEQILRPRRVEDLSPDLWTVLNRVQENVIRGGLRGRAVDGSRRTTRAVTGIDQDVRLNRALWTLADEMRRLKSA